MQGRYAQLQKMLADAPVRSPLASPRDAAPGEGPSASGAEGAMDNDERVVSPWSVQHIDLRVCLPSGWMLLSKSWVGGLGLWVSACTTGRPAQCARPVCIELCDDPVSD